MDKLPLNLLGRIIKDAAIDRLTTRGEIKKCIAPYASVSNRFRQVVERTTFREIAFVREDIAAISFILNRYERWLCVRTVKFVVLLPQYEDRLDQLETPQETAKNSQIYALHIALLVDLLSQYPACNALAYSRAASIKLNIHVYSPTDWYVREYSDDIYDRGFEAMNDHRFTQVWRHHRSVMRHVGYLPLQSLQHVPIEKIGFPGHPVIRHKDANFLTEMISVMNLGRLNSIQWGFGDVDKNDVPRRCARRRDLADAIDSLPELSEFNLTYSYVAPYNHDYQPPILCHPNESDAVSCSIRRLSQRTKNVTITGILASTEIFWPKAGLRDGLEPKPSWESLERLNILFHPITPEGNWLFERDYDIPIFDIPYVDLRPLPVEIRAEEDAEWNQWRYAPIQRRMDDLYQAVGRAVANMPKLRCMHLEFIHHLEPLTTRAAEPVEHLFTFEVFEDRKAKALWYSKPQYEPSDIVKKVWMNSAYELCVDLQIQVISKSTYDDYNWDDDGEGEEDDLDDDSRVVIVIR
ncbi:uncharacterized protein GGS22DRAFT_188146 [Annulohypoxylon maeteangense]|uniref:uncharacterized protein n=1 Tax=Annulohypoxylon maeteangense TaxID=1927788 RepID=UPI0020080FEA|nr:uncharacterized protein GGS22DRAFT_188146 [Annulohypoxylon maeteangense]KAI0885858.1 hypothetical protein GGS22DRAFT_188146 [Annulohypoxylon maeteangense]